MVVASYPFITGTSMSIRIMSKHVVSKVETMFSLSFSIHAHFHSLQYAISNYVQKTNSKSVLRLSDCLQPTLFLIGQVFHSIFSFTNVGVVWICIDSL